MLAVTMVATSLLGTTGASVTAEGGEAANGAAARRKPDLVVTGGGVALRRGGGFWVTRSPHGSAVYLVAPHEEHRRSGIAENPDRRAVPPAPGPLSRAGCTPRSRAGTGRVTPGRRALRGEVR